jgi:hypothetical protein
MKLNWIMIMTFIAVMLIGCSNETNHAAEETAENQEDTAAAEKDNDAPIIDEDHTSDERGALANAIQGQREQLKFSFITDDYHISHIGTTADAQENKFVSSATYTYPNVDSGFAFEAGTMLSDRDFIEEAEAKTFDQPALKASYGVGDDGGGDRYFISGKDENNIKYIMTTQSASNGYTDEMMEQMIKSMKTEEDGAYDPLYKFFSLISVS